MVLALRQSHIWRLINDVEYKYGVAMKPKRVAVVGAGPAGLATSYALLQKGIEVEVFEADNAVGGMAKTISLWGQFVDLGPHRFFSSDPRVNQIWLEVIGDEYSMVNRLTRIYYKERFFDYPLKPYNALSGLGFWESLRCILSYISANLFHARDGSTFEGWVTSRFGSRLFEIFFKSYSEKLWGISCKALDADFAVQRIKKLSLIEAIKSAFFGSGETKHKTLVDEFAYPNLGAGIVYERMAGKVLGMNGKIHLNCRIVSVHPISPEHSSPIIKFSDGTSRAFDHVVSTMPITLLVEQMRAPEEIYAHSNALKFRNTILVYLKISEENLFPDQWIYVHSANLQTGRITNFKNWVPSINQGHSDAILCLEYWCDDSDAIWTADENELVKLATREIYLTGLVSTNCVLDGHLIRIPRSYPVYAIGYKRHLKPIQKFFSTQKGISVIGRYGSFKYNNQDHSILMGMLCAENLADGASHDLWQLNTDYEYQESSTITASGLSK